MAVFNPFTTDKRKRRNMGAGACDIDGAAGRGASGWAAGRGAKNKSDDSVRYVHLVLFDTRMTPSIPARTLVVFDRTRRPTDGDVIAVGDPDSGYDIGRYSRVGGEIAHDNQRFRKRRVKHRSHILGTMLSWHCPEPSLFDQVDRDGNPAVVAVSFDKADTPATKSDPSARLRSSERLGTPKAAIKAAPLKSAPLKRSRSAPLPKKSV